MAGETISCMQGLSTVQSDFESLISIPIHAWWKFYQNTPFLVGQAAQNTSAQVIRCFIDFAFQRNAIEVSESIKPGTFCCFQPMDLHLFFSCGILCSGGTGSSIFLRINCNFGTFVFFCRDGDMGEDSDKRGSRVGHVRVEATFLFPEPANPGTLFGLEACHDAIDVTLVEASLVALRKIVLVDPGQEVCSIGVG